MKMNNFQMFPEQYQNMSFESKRMIFDITFPENLYYISSCKILPSGTGNPRDTRTRWVSPASARTRTRRTRRPLASLTSHLPSWISAGWPRRRIECRVVPALSLALAQAPTSCLGLILLRPVLIKVSTPGGLRTSCHREWVNILFFFEYIIFRLLLVLISLLEKLKSQA